MCFRLCAIAYVPLCFKVDDLEVQIFSEFCATSHFWGGLHTKAIARLPSR